MSKLESLIYQSGLTDIQVAKLEPIALGFWGYQEFINYWGIDPDRETKSYSGNGFGLSDNLSFNTPYSVACNLLNLRHCRRFGQDLGISYSTTSGDKRNVQNQMRHIMNNNEPIVFFVPPNLFEHEKHGLTMEEMRYLLRQGDKYPPKTHFVFGLHEPLVYSYLTLLSMTH